MISLQAAREAGLSRYETGKPCVHGHISERFVSSRKCVACSRIQKNNWAAKNRDHIHAYNVLYYEEDAENQRLRSRSYVSENREQILVKRRAAYHADPDRAMKWARENKERVRQIQRDWHAKNPEKSRSKVRNRRAMISENGGHHTADDIIDIFSMQNGRCAYCRIKVGKKYHVDHIVAVSKGGSNGRNNLQILCQPCNQTKFAKDPIVFAQSLGMLL